MLKIFVVQVLRNTVNKLNMRINYSSLFLLITFLALIILMPNCTTDKNANKIKPNILRIEIATDDNIN